MVYDFQGVPNVLDSYYKTCYDAVGDLEVAGLVVKALKDAGLKVEEEGDGSAIHNPKEFAKAARIGVKEDSPPQPWASRFIASLKESVVGETGTGVERIVKMWDHGSFKLANPTFEHFAAVAVAVGMAGDDDLGILLMERWSCGVMWEGFFGFGLDDEFVKSLAWV
ncbi:hypothetical protein HDU76_013512 [Blyttiomyces sp. JEL0837]|nr:hypothetical protein HDU76_013512 [Blyttiomyces sp. JEL0837]